MENIFQQGELTLTEAVFALKSPGFGKSAAYQALSADGQFSAWLQFAPDEMISWNYWRVCQFRHIGHRPDNIFRRRAK